MQVFTRNRLISGGVTEQGCYWITSVNTKLMFNFGGVYLFVVTFVYWGLTCMMSASNHSVCEKDT